MTQKTATCRDECVDGLFRIFIANFSTKLLREVYVRCPFCHSDTQGAEDEPILLTGEEKITLNVYYEYVAQGWQETDPV